MDTRAPDRIDIQRQQVLELLATHPLHPSVDGYEVRFDETWDGEPGVWVMFHQPGTARGTEAEIRDLTALMKELVGRLRDIAPDREGFVRFIVPPSKVA